MSYYGDIRLGDTIDVKFTTIQVSGAPTTLSGSPVISAYVGNSTTQLTAGITLSVDFDSVTGLNSVRVVATGGNGYATASNYDLIITTGTVNSVSVVGYKVASFSIEARSALMPTTVARTLVVDAAGLADANTVKVGPTGSGTAQTARDIGLSVLLSAGTGTGQLDFTSGVVKANLAQILGTALTETAGQIAAAFKKFFDIASPTSTMNRITLVDTTTTLTNAPPDSSGTTTLLSRVTGSVMLASSYTAPDNTSIATILTRTDVATSTRMATFVYTAPPSAATISAAVWSATGDGAYTYAQMLGYSWAFAAGTLSGVSSNAPVFISKGLGFTITATQVADGRSVVTLS